MNMENNRKCAFCGEKAEKKCHNCGTYYCSRQCQLKDWKVHRVECRKYAKRELRSKYRNRVSEVTKKEKDDNIIRMKTRFGSIPKEIIGEICLFYDDPEVLLSLVLLNKHFFLTIYSDDFHGSVNMLFMIGMKRFPNKNISDDDLFKKMFPKASKEKYSLTYKKKRFGMTDLRFTFNIDIRIPYVRKLRIVEFGVMFDTEAMNRVFSMFYRLKHLYASGMPFFRNEIFTSNPTTRTKLSVLDICGSNKLTYEIFLSSSSTLSQDLEELHLNSTILPDLKKRNITLKFNKLRKLVIKAPFTGCTQWERPEIDTKNFTTYISSPCLRELQFLHVKFENPVKIEDDQIFFLENIPTLRTLKILDPDGFVRRIVQRLNQLISLDVEALEDRFFYGLRNLRVLKLRGGVESKTTHRIFKFVPNLETLDLTHYNGFELLQYSSKLGMFEEEEVLKFLVGLRRLYMCCDRSNYVMIIRKAVEKGKTLHSHECRCTKNLEERDINDEIRGGMGETLKEGRLVHLSCVLCRSGCERCGNNKENKVGCPKLEKEKCHECGRRVCCTTSCEKCSRGYCPCLRVVKRFGFCSGSVCEYERMCMNCINELRRCENEVCRATICIECSSKCTKCDKILCEENCIVAYVYDGDDDYFDEEIGAIDGVIPEEKRVCKNCE